MSQQREMSDKSDADQKKDEPRNETEAENQTAVNESRSSFRCVTCGETFQLAQISISEHRRQPGHIWNVK